jgi:hypothetical protein
MTEFIRTPRNGCFQVRTNAWGSFLSPVPDPDAHADLEDGALERFELNTGIDKIPADLWSRWVQLCFHFAHLKQGDLEVSCRLLRKDDDRSQWRILVPQQEVSGASVRIDTFDSSIDIETGELIETYPPAGWVPAGSSHSHNSMPLAKFSSIDDKSELGCPGLHIVISHISIAKNTYVPTASVTANHRRFYLDDAADVVDLTPAGTTFHRSVLDIIQPERTRWGYDLQGAWLPGHLSREEAAVYGSSTSTLKRSDHSTTTAAPKRNKIDRLSNLEEYGVSPDDLLEDSLLDVLESLEQVRAICFEHGIDFMRAHSRVMDAVNFTFDEDDPIWYSDDITDLPSDATCRTDSPTPVRLPAGQW